MKPNSLVENSFHKELRPRTLQYKRVKIKRLNAIEILKLEGKSIKTSFYNLGENNDISLSIQRHLNGYSRSGKRIFFINS